VPPAVSTQEPTGITNISFTFNGSVGSMGTATTLSAWFDYYDAITGRYLGDTPHRPRTAAGHFDETVSGMLALRPGGLFDYQARGDAGDHGSASGELVRFRMGDAAVWGDVHAIEVTAQALVELGAVMEGRPRHRGDCLVAQAAHALARL
jgi:hypothetical protein